MPRQLQINVQIDPLPAQGPNPRFGVRLSAWIVPDAADRAQPGDRNLLMPWRWTGRDPTQPTNPASFFELSWKAWWVVPPSGGNPAQATAASLTTHVNGAAGNPLPAQWWDKVDATVDAFESTPFDPTTLEQPAGSVSHRTLFGFVESLTALPAPLPEAQKVWACVEVTTPAPPGSELVIAPLFGVHVDATTYAYFDLDQDPTSKDLVSYTRKDAQNLAIDATAAISRVEQAVPVNRIMLQQQFLVGGAGAWAGAGSDDWMITLPSRIAELLDPARRLTEAVEALLAGPPAALAIDWTKPPLRNAVRLLLAAVYWRVFARTATGGAGVTPVQIATVLSRPGDAPRTLLAGLSLRDASVGPAATPAGFFASEQLQPWPDSRMLSLLGMPPDPGAAPDAAPNWGPELATSEGAKTWLLAHWAGAPPAVALDVTPIEVMKLRALRWDPGVAAVVTDAANESGLLDPSVLKDGDAAAFRLLLRAPAAGADLVAVLHTDGLAATTEISLPVPAGDTPLTIALRRTAAGPEFAMQFGSTPPVSAAVTESAALSRRAHVSLKLRNPAAGIELRAAKPEGEAGELVPLKASADSLRAAAGLVYAAPFIGPIIAGLKPDGTDAGAGNPVERIIDAMAAWSASRMAAEYDEAKRLALAAVPSLPGAVSNADIAAVDGFFTLAVNAAASNAAAKASIVLRGLSQSASDHAITLRAQPVVFPVDQPKPVDGGSDLWAMFAGTAVIAGVGSPGDEWPAGDRWFSLNLADMHAPDAAGGVRHPLSDDNRIGTYDPVPMQIGEIGGVRAAGVTYDNRTLVGEMPADPLHDGPAAADGSARRIEAYGFPKSARLPALCFGKAYFFLPYLVGHGGALPLCLRRDREIPTVLRDLGNAFPRTEFEADLPNGVQVVDVVRKVDYRRTTPVGAPRFAAEEGIPGIPAGVDPIASEIPIRPVPLTLRPGETAFFYRNKERTEGTLDFQSPDAAKRALQIEFGAFPVAHASAAPASIELTVAGNDTAAPFLKLMLQSTHWNTSNGRLLGLKVTVSRQGVTILTQMDDPDFAEYTPTYQATDAAVVPTPFDAWRSFSIAVSNTSGGDVAIMPPVVSLGTERSNDFQLADGRPVPLTESPHQKRFVTVIDEKTGTPGRSALRLRVRRPAVDFSTYERWINWKLTDADIKSCLDIAHRRVTVDKPTKNDDLTINDPAVERIAIELVEIFPHHRHYGLKFMKRDWAGKDAIKEAFRLPDHDLQVVVSVDAAAGIDVSNDTSQVRVEDGCVYELRFYGAVPLAAQSFCTGLALAQDRFGPGPWHGLPVASDASGKRYRLGAPLVRTIEVATERLPELHGGGDVADPIDILPRSSGGGLRLANGMPTGTGLPERAAIRFTQNFLDNNYPAVRYFRDASLLSQRWGWRGRPLPERPEFRTGNGQRQLAGEVRNFEDVAFVDRRDDDVGVIDDVKLVPAHALPQSGIARPEIFLKDLLYRGGANWWRFALAASSRYAPMKPGRNLTKYSYVTAERDARASWHNLLVADRDTGRVVKRPGLALVLPLTESVMPDQAVPPLLAIFSEPMFPGFHIGDGVEAALDYARHPKPPTGLQRFWPQIGPDPILTGRGHSGEPVPLRLDGPIGYTFDRETEAPKFINSGFLVTPVTAHLEPWTMARLRFRRLEAVETSSAEPHDVVSGTNWLISSDGTDAAKPRERHEGLVVDLGLRVDGTETDIEVQVSKSETGPGLGHSIKIKAKDADGQLRIEVIPDLGTAGTYSLSHDPAGVVRLRIVISEREKPEQGETGYEPVLDISVRVLIDDPVADSIVRDHAGAWITVACVPLLAGAKDFRPRDPVYAVLSTTASAQVRAARLSLFTPPVWCQFTQDVSRFSVTSTGTDPAVPCHVNDLSVTFGAQNKPALTHTASGTPARKISWLPADPTSEIEGMVVAVVTQFVTDAFDRLREKPVAVWALNDGGNSPHGVTELWTASAAVTDPALTSLRRARVRLMSLMHRRGQPPAKLGDYFPEALEDEIGMDPDDSRGRIIGVSKPIEIGV